MLSKKIVLIKHFEGVPKRTDFDIVEENIPEDIKDGEILAEAEWLSVDPYMRNATKLLKLGDTMPGRQVAVILKSKNKDYPVGSKVVGNFGWRTLTVYHPAISSTSPDYDNLYLLPDMLGLPESYALGSVGRIGNTAYFGFLRLCQPKEDETVVVSAAGGAVGSIVAQIAKIKGCKVLAFAGTEDKLKWLKDDLGIEHVFNYKTVDLDATFKQFAPNGIDCYFDNVGGEFTYHVTKSMNPFGRIALCGAISVYNNDATSPTTVPFDYLSLIYKNIRMEGFIVSRWKSEWLTGICQLRDWVLEGKVKVQETITEGFSNMPEAFIGLFSGSNVGKQVIKISK